jgi:hypothetical protein
MRSVVRLIVGVFILLHGLVHLLSSGHSRRLYELRPDMAWPDGSWVFSAPLGDGATRSLASVLYALAALGFLAGGAGMLIGQAWWRPVVVGSAAFSAVNVVLFRDGRLHRLDDQGGIALLIDLTLLAVLLIVQWPRVGR